MSVNRYSSVSTLDLSLNLSLPTNLNKVEEAPRDEVLSLEDNVLVPVMETIDITLF
jgi:hypothetical protein